MGLVTNVPASGPCESENFPSRLLTGNVYVCILIAIGRVAGSIRPLSQRAAMGYHRTLDFPSIQTTARGPSWAPN